MCFDILQERTSKSTDSKNVAIFYNTQRYEPNAFSLVILFLF